MGGLLRESHGARRAKFIVSLGAEPALRDAMFGRMKAWAAAGDAMHDRTARGLAASPLLVRADAARLAARLREIAGADSMGACAKIRDALLGNGARVDAAAAALPETLPMAADVDGAAPPLAAAAGGVLICSTAACTSAAAMLRAEAPACLACELACRYGRESAVCARCSIIMLAMLRLGSAFSPPRRRCSVLAWHALVRSCRSWARPMGVYRSAVVLLCYAQVAADDANETECRALGFGPSLLCSSCHKLGEFVGESDPLVSECTGCCKEESDHASVVYASAVLDVCR